jgi:hypothetical protein
MGDAHFSLVSGGPFHRLTLHFFPDESRRATLYVALVGVTWLPLLVIASVDRLIHGHGLEILRDLSVHARFLIAIPLFLAADRCLDERTRRVIVRFRADELSERPEIVEAALKRCRSLRDSRIAEAILLMMAVINGQLVLWQLLRPGGLATGFLTAASSVAWKWYALVALPCFSFLLFRSLWHWLIWCYLLWCLVRAGIQPLPMHPDRSGGLSFFARPTIVVLLIGVAINSVFCAGWLTQAWLGSAKATTYRNSMIALVVSEAILAYLPLVMFSLLLYRAQRNWSLEHGHLAAVATRAFNERWVGHPRGESLLEAQDPTAMANYSSVFRLLSEMRLVPFSLRAVARFIAMVSLPAIPVALTALPLAEVLRKISSVIKGVPP